MGIFGSKQDTQEHCRRCNVRYNGYLCYLQANDIMGNEAREQWGKLEEAEKVKWAAIARVKTKKSVLGQKKYVTGKNCTFSISNSKCFRNLFGRSGKTVRQ